MPSERRSLVIETIYDPEEAGKGPATLDLVLIHGLDGDRINTWTHPKTKVFWPRDLLPKKQPRTRVLSFGYNADILGNTSIAGIRGNARALLARLKDEREDDEAEVRPLVFVAHSLGAIIVKQALRFAANEAEYHQLAAATRGLLFYGAPHHGADQDRWLAISKSFGRLVPCLPGLSKSNSNNVSPLVESLARSSRDIADICEDFRQLAQRFAVISFYETRAWPGTKEPIVDKLSSVMNIAHEDQVPLEADHLQLVRFEDENDDAFRLTYKRIARAAKGVPGYEPRFGYGAAAGGRNVINQYVWVGGAPGSGKRV